MRKGPENEVAIAPGGQASDPPTSAVMRPEERGRVLGFWVLGFVVLGSLYFKVEGLGSMGPGGQSGRLVIDSC